MAIKLSKKPATKRKVSKLAQAIEKYDEAIRALAAFREEHPEVFERLSELEEERNAADAQVRAYARADLESVTPVKGKPLQLAKHGSFVVQASAMRKVDAAVLLEENPKLRKVARITYSINNDEVDRLLAAGVLDAATVKKAETLTHVVKIVVSTDHEEPE